MTENAETASPTPYRPTAVEVEELLHRAASHPLGTGFLLDGSLDAVAATFRVHAFCVDAARDTLRSGPGTAQQAPAIR